MRIVYAPGATPEWWAGLSPWQREDLAAVHRQGKHLRDGTNHGSDERWQQAGVKTYDRFYGPRTRNSRRTGHERIVIRPTDYGYEKIGIRRANVFTIDGETGVASLIEDAWTIVWVWYVSESSSASFPPHQDQRSSYAGT